MDGPIESPIDGSEALCFSTLKRDKITEDMGILRNHAVGHILMDIVRSKRLRKNVGRRPNNHAVPFQNKSVKKYQGNLAAVSQGRSVLQ